MILIKNSHLPKHSQTFAILATQQQTALTIRAVLNSRMRAKFGLRDIGFMILNLKDNFVNYNVISNLLVSLLNLTCSSQ
jgi:hypothetical protein